jgi:hypothetical protein
MACYKQWAYFVGAFAGYVGGVATVIGGVVAEVGSGGTMTPAAIAAVVAGIATMIASLAAIIGTEIDLLECYEAAGKHDDAAKIRAKLAVHQDEHDRLVALSDKLKAAVGI